MTDLRPITPVDAPVVTDRPVAPAPSNPPSAPGSSPASAALAPATPSFPALRLLVADDALVCVDDTCLPEEPRA